MKKKEEGSSEPKNEMVLAGGFTLTPRTLDEAMKFAELIANSDLAPRDFKGKAGNVLVAVQMGLEVGLKPLQAIQNIAVINGRPCMWGDACLGVVLAAVDGNGKKVLESLKEEFDEKQMLATCTAKRRDNPEIIVRTFSMADAQKAGLAKKEGTWQTYTKRMLQMRARSWVLRDGFADVLKGLAVREEVEDYAPIEKPTTKLNVYLPERIAEPQQALPELEQKPTPAETDTLVQAEVENVIETGVKNITKRTNKDSKGKINIAYNIVCTNESVYNTDNIEIAKTAKVAQINGTVVEFVVGENNQIIALQEIGDAIEPQ